MLKSALFVMNAWLSFGVGVGLYVFWIVSVPIADWFWPMCIVCV